LEIARWVVRHKLLGYDLPLDALAGRHGLADAARERFLARRDQALAALDTAAAHGEVLGIEGQVAHAWFALVAAALNPAWAFTGRNRRPPRDPVNALLSLGYTLLGAEVHHGVMTAGLDPSLGFLHQPFPGREAMVLDLTEIFRGGVDQFVLSWIDPVGPDKRHWYYREEEGCRLAKTRRPAFYSTWAARRAEWPYPIAIAEHEGWPWGALREQINGWIERLRAEMKRLAPLLEDPQP
jgi:CRISPR-associated protein Cas1